MHFPPRSTMNTSEYFKECAPQARNFGILALKFVNFLKILKAKTYFFSRLRRAFSLSLLNVISLGMRAANHLNYFMKDRSSFMWNGCFWSAPLNTQNHFSRARRRFLRSRNELIMLLGRAAKHSEIIPRGAEGASYARWNLLFLWCMCQNQSKFY